MISLFKKMLPFAIATLLSAVCSVNAADHTVTVGDSGKIAFSPTTVTADVNDTVIFEFKSGTHTVTQSSFAHPCVQAAGGFTSNDKTSGDTYNLTVADLNPIYIFCDFGDHCRGNGMVFVVNPPDQKDLNSWISAAKSGATLTSAAPTATSSGSSTSSSDAPESTGTGTGTGTHAASTATSSADNSPSNSANIISGGGVLSAAMALLVGLAL